jgi:hypothetical protein
MPAELNEASASPLDKEINREHLADDEAMAGCPTFAAPSLRG